MSHPRLAATVVAAAFGLSGCIDDSGDPLPLPDADLEVFVDEVQPVLAQDCSKDSCHGDPGRPLGLYAVGAARIEAQLEDTEEDLTQEELSANHTRARGFLVGIEGPEHSLLVTKPLPVADGGTVHDPGPVFESDVDHRYVVMLDWVALAFEDGGQT